MIPMISNVAGAAQAQRHNAFNQNKADQVAKDAAARAVRDRLMLGLVDAGVNAAMTFGGKAYDEATTGDRAERRLKSDLAQVERDNVLDLAAKGIDQLGYTPKPPTPTPSYSDGSMGRTADERGAARGRGGIEGAGEVPRLMTAQGPRETSMADTTDPYAALSPLQKAAQTTLERSRQAERESAIAQARADAQKRADALAKQDEANRLKSYELIGGLQTATQQRYGQKGRPANAPQFGVQPEVDERGIVRPKFTEPMKPAPMPSGGGGRARQAAAEPYPGSEQIPVVAILQNRKGQPTALPRSLMNNVEWARAVTSNPEQFANVETDRPALARALRILDNPSVPMDVRANTLTEINKLASKAIETHGPAIGWATDTMAASPADTARAAQEEAARAARAKLAEEERLAKLGKANADVELAGLAAEGEIVKIEATARDRANRLAADIGRSSRAQLAGLSPAAYAEAMLGGQPPGDLTPRQLQAWQRAAKDGAPIRDARDRLRAAAKREAEIKSRGAAPGVSLAPVDLSTHESIRAAVADGRITRQQAAEAFRKLGEVVTE